MPGGHPPGPICGFSNTMPIDDGTLVRSATPRPGPVCATLSPKPEQVAEDLLSGRVYAFIFVEEPLKEGVVVRKVYVTTTAPYLKRLQLTPLEELAEVRPEKYGPHPRAPNAPAGAAEHALGIVKKTPFVSASGLPEGTPRMEGRPVFIDIARARAAGVKIFTTQEIVAAINRYVAEHPHLRKRAAKLMHYIENVDKEVLLQGSTPRTAVYGSKAAMESAVKVARFAKVLSVVGVAFTAYDLSVATGESVRLRSGKPLVAEGIRQAGGWAGAIGGFKLGFGAGALMGVETGPGLIVTGLVGGLVVGAMGFFGADWIADHIHEN